MQTIRIQILWLKIYILFHYWLLENQTLYSLQKGIACCSCWRDIRKRSGNQFSNTDVGHAVSFGEKVFQLQPRWSYVYLVLTDCRLICIYKVTRCDSGNSDNVRFSYEYVLPSYLNYESRDYPPAGWKYLVTIMESNQKKTWIHRWNSTQIL